MAQERSTISVSPSGVADAPVQIDALGFEPYVDAVAAFLLDEKTSPPLTLSVEGSWGTGKSSFMLQVRRKIEEAIASRGLKHRVVWINAWRNEKSESVWAAFALIFVRDLSKGLSRAKIFAANLSLARKRVDWSSGRWRALRAAMFLVAALVLAFWGIGRGSDLLEEFGITESSNTRINALGFAALTLGLLAAAIPKIQAVFENSLARDLAYFVSSPAYGSQVAYIEQFEEDFRKIVDTYVPHGRVYAFVDDLDRCSVPQAAAITEALNLLTSAAGDRLVFVIGLDREIVAAGLAAKYKDLLPFLTPERGRDQRIAEHGRAGLTFGYTFLEKFIQVPFRVPRPDRVDVRRLITPVITSNSGVPDRVSNYVVSLGEESAAFLDLVSDLSFIFDHNPRRVKQFVNILRLRMVIAFETGLLDGALSPSQLALFTAVVTRWPDIVGDLGDDPTLLARLSGASDPPVPGNADSYWATHPGLKAALNRNVEASLRDVDIRPLLAVSPKVRRANRGLPFSADNSGSETVRQQDIALPPSQPSGAQSAYSGGIEANPDSQARSEGVRPDIPYKRVRIEEI